jgi:pimeloyl-ACP methyl ester carboxylesterase
MYSKKCLFLTFSNLISNIFIVFVVFIIAVNAQQDYRAERIIVSENGADNTNSQEFSTALNNYRVSTGGRVVIGTLNYYDAWKYPTSPFSGSYLGGILGGGDTTGATDINDNSVAVGYCRYASYYFRPCKWLQNTSSVAHSLQLPVEYLDGYAKGINNNGSIVGVVDDYKFSSNGRAFYQPAGTEMTLIAAEGSVAKSVNDSEKVVGVVNNQAFIWDSNTGIRILNTVIGANGWNFTDAVKINNAGQIIGYGFLNGAEKAFFWDGTQVHSLGNKNETQVYGLNNAGHVAGSRASQNVFGWKAFVWDEDDGIQDLSIDNGWLLVRAKDINDRGAIVADGYNSNSGLQRAWILTPKNIKPLIFVPGVGGSILKDSTKPDNDILWVNPNDLLFRVFPKDLSPLSLNPANANPNIIAPDALRYDQHPRYGSVYETYGLLIDSFLNQGYREYIVNSPDDRTNNGCKDEEQRANNPNLFVFAYDWRKSNAENALLLSEYVQCVQQFYPNTKVDIVAHSMGGVLSRRYILDYPQDHHVDKMITIATPWLGAPKAIYSLETGRFFFNSLIPFSFTDVERHGTALLDFRYSSQIKTLFEDYKGGQELIPSNSYYLLGGRPFEDLNTHASLISFLNSQHPRTTPGTTSNNFHTIPQDDWRQDLSSVKYYHIYSTQNKNLTPGRFVRKQTTTCAGGGTCFTVNGLSVEATFGDGTVPIISSRRRNNGIDLNYRQNQPNDYRFFVVSPSNAADDALAEHNGLHKNPAVQRLVTDLLFYPNYGVFYTDAPGAGSAGVKADLTPTPGLQLNQKTTKTMEGVDSYYLSIYGMNPETLKKSLPIIGSFTNSDSYFDVWMIGENDAQIIIDPTETYEVNFNSIGQPMRIEILKGKTNTEATEAVRYLDVNLPAGTKVLLNFSANGVENLKYDIDGDGVFESEILPTTAVSGTNALDNKAPTVAFNYQILTQTVSISAADTESGTRRIYFSINGTNFLEYSQPITVNPAINPRIYAFAEDNAGNRSQIYNQVLLVPTAATASISGRVLGRIKATVRLTSANGEITTVRTSTFGYYKFDNLPVGETYIVQPVAKGVHFSPSNLVFNLDDIVENADFMIIK